MCLNLKLNSSDQQKKNIQNSKIKLVQQSNNLIKTFFSVDLFQQVNRKITNFRLMFLHYRHNLLNSDILHLLTKFPKAQQSHHIQVFGLKIIRCSIFQRCTFPKALLIALCPLLGRIMIIFHIVLGMMHRKFNTQKVNAIN